MLTRGPAVLACCLLLVVAGCAAEPASPSTAATADDFAVESASVDLSPDGTLATVIPGSAVLGVRVR